MDDAIYFAKTNFRSDEKIFGIRNSDRRQHFYIIGKSGTGKTSLLANMALQDIQNGKGVAIVDPHGDFVEEIARRIPEERANDTIYFNPSDIDYPIGFNVLEVSDPKYKHLVVSDLMGIFTKIWSNVWSARMEYILSNCVLALLDTPGTTLLGITRILVDQDYRRRIVQNIKDPVVKAFWMHEFEIWTDKFRSEAIVPIQNKVGQFLSTSFIRNIVGQPKSALNIGEIMNSGKILLLNVSKGKIGEDNSNLLGAMLITKIQLAAMERVRIAEDERRDFYLYVDEFQNFATDSFASILSEARKYRLNLIVAHQYIGQLVTDTSTRVRDAIFGNVGTMLVFRTGATDAEFLEKEFEPEFTIQDLISLPNHNIYLRLMVNGITSRPFSATTLPPITAVQKEADEQKIIERSRALYGSKREDVEKNIKRWSELQGEFADEDFPKQNEEKNQATCWVCGRETEVKFKPEKGRPIYCVSCLKKIEKGEVSAINLPKFGKEKAKKFEPSLGMLGIEFEDGGARDDFVRNDLDKPFAIRDGLSIKQEGKQFSGTHFFSRRKEDFKKEIGAEAADNTRKGEFVFRFPQDEVKKPLSLSDLKKESIKNEAMQKIKEERRKKIIHSEENLGGLREILKEALGKKIDSEENKGKEQNASSDESDFSDGVKKSENNVENKKIIPGSTVKFE